MKPARVLLLGTILLALLLRVINLDGRAIWYDEGFSIFLSARDYGDLARGAVADVHPLLYYALLHEWMRFVGSSAFAVRFLSVAFGVATVASVYRLARTLLNKPVARISMLLLALAPFHIAYSQEARMYVVLGCLTVVATWALVEFQKTRARGWWLLFVLSGVGAVYSHNLGFLSLAVISGGVWVRALARRDFSLLVSVTLAGALIVVVWLPWLLRVPAQFGKIEEAYWVTRPDAVTLVQTLVTFVVDFDNARLPLALLPSALFAALLLLIVGALKFSRQRASAIIFCAACALIPLLSLVIISLWHPLYLPRIVMPSFLLLVVVVAWGLWRLPRRPRQVLCGGLLALAAASLSSYYEYAEFPRPPFREAQAMLAAQVQSDDAIVHDNKLTYFPMRYYDARVPATFVADPVGAGSDTLARPTQEALQIFPSTLAAAVGTHSTVWFIIFDEAAQQGSSNLAWMNEHYRLARLEHLHDLDIYLYQK